IRWSEAASFHRSCWSLGSILDTYPAMKTKRILLMTAVVAGMIGARADAQNMFVSDYWADSIYYFTPDGVRNTFATGLAGPGGLPLTRRVICSWRIAIAVTSTSSRQTVCGVPSPPARLTSGE